MYGVDNDYRDGSGHSEAALARASREGPRSAKLADSRAIPYPDGFFDAIVSHHVLEHVRDLDAVVEAMHRALKPMGVMLHIFPTREVLIDDHVGLPFVHRIRQGATLRLRFAACARRPDL